MTKSFAFASLTATVALAACGAGTDGGSPNPPSYVELLDTSSDETSDLDVHSVDLESTAVASSQGSIDRNSQTIMIGNADATLDDGLQSGTLDSGGFVTIEPEATSFVAAFVIEPIGSQPSFGVLGVPTAGADVPQNGSVTYTGTDSASLQIVDGEAVYDLIGDITANARFGNETVEMTFSALDGTRLTGSSEPVDVADVATIAVAGSSISDNDFSGGDATLTSNQLSSDLTGAENVLVSGSFYGPQADELGGVILINDTVGAGNLLIQGWYTAD